MDIGEDRVEGDNEVTTSFNNGENQNQVPYLGMKFDSEESAYEFYKSYASRNGFAVRKHFVKKRPNGQVKRRTYCCSRQGFKGVDKRREKVLFTHEITRVGCLAQITCRLQSDGFFEVVSFTEEHNHELGTHPRKSVLKSNREIENAEKAAGNVVDEKQMPVKSRSNCFPLQNGGPGFNGIVDIHGNYTALRRQIPLPKGDASAIMEYFRRVQFGDPSFYYAVQLDDNDLITNVFWADTRSMIDYRYFGDVVCFDTSYRTKHYARPFAQFVGANHHKQIVIFGAALLYSETKVSYTWLFNSFIGAMHGKQPETILTGQNAVICEAAREVFSESHHRICVWQLYQDAVENLGHQLFSSENFAGDFSSCLYDYEDEAEWHAAWNDMLQRHMLTDNTWLLGIFKEKEKWATVYGRNMFTADMKCTELRESVNDAIKECLKPDYKILLFFEHYTRLLAHTRYQEVLADLELRQTMPALQANVEMLRHASELYTPSVFKMFQAEFVKAWDCTINKVSKSQTTTEYKVTYGGKAQEHLVIFESSTNRAHCSCMKFNFVGILCSHALKVLDRKNIKNIPSQYILKRWRKDAKIGDVEDCLRIDMQGCPVVKRYLQLSYNFSEISMLASENQVMYEHALEGLASLHRGLHKIKRSCGSNSSDGLGN